MKQLLPRLEYAGRIAENAALVILLSALMLVAVGQILLREVFSTGFIWADELVRLIVLWLAMFGSIAACRDNRHIRIDALGHVLPERAVGIVRIVVDLFAAIVCVFLAWHSWRYLQLEIEFEDSVLVDLPAWVAHIIVPVAFVIMAWHFAALAGVQGLGLTRKEKGAGQ